jgi:hypothetical protein
MINPKEKKKLREFHYVLEFLQKNYDTKLREYNNYSKWWNFTMKRDIKKQLDEIQTNIILYSKLVQEYESKWWYND